MITPLHSTAPQPQ